MVASPPNIGSVSLFETVETAPPDPILGLTEAFVADQRPEKVNLGVGVYQNSAGKVPLLSSVHEAEKRLLDKGEAKSYLPIDGLAPYNKLVRDLLFGANSQCVAEGRTVTAQSLGGTGALKIGADFLHRACGVKDIWISTPSWENHRALFEAAGMAVHQYPYYNPETRSADFDAMYSALQALEANTVVLLHACCHNPTGADLTNTQWESLVELFLVKGLVPFLDFAYQGFGEGIEQDAYSVRAFAESGLRCLIANSFSKSFSLYRERVGALTLVTNSAAEAKTLISQVKRVIRTNYSSPASHGAQIVTQILTDPELTSRWQEELSEMRVRIHAMRAELAAELNSAGLSFDFIVQQHGMFSYSGLSVQVVRKLRDDFGLYIVDSGRICVAALNSNNLGYTAAAIKENVAGGRLGHLGV